MAKSDEDAFKYFKLAADKGIAAAQVKRTRSYMCRAVSESAIFKGRELNNRTVKP